MAEPPQTTLDGPHEDTTRLYAMVRLLSNRTLTETVESLRAHGVRPLVLKGPWFAQWLYDDPADRPPGDVDLIVDPADVPAARRALSALGFSPWAPPAHAREKPVHHEAWEREDLGILRVELHHTLALVDADPATVWRHVSADTRTIQVAGVDVETPGEAVGALLVGLHAAQHGLTLPKPLMDLERALARLDDGTWRRAAQIAAALEAGAAFAAGLSLKPRGAELARRLGLDAQEADRAVRLRGAAPDGAALTIEWLLTELRTRSGLAARARLLGRLVVPPRARMLDGYPLARRGRSGLLAAYLMRPLRVARMVPRGLWTWHRVARRRPHGRWTRLPRVAAAAGSLAAAWIALRLVPFALVVRAAGLRRGEATTDVGDAEAARAAGVAAAIVSAAARLPWDCNCLTQAAAGAILLRCQRLPATIHFGVLRDGTSGQIEAHAWLTCGTEVLTGDAGRERFAEIATYSSR